MALGQLGALGLSSTAVRGQLGSRLHRVHREVFAVGHRALRREGHWMAGVLACGADAYLSHRSAAALWDLRPSSATRLDVTVRGRQGRTRAGLRVHCGARLARDETDVRHAIPCTTPSRTILDLASVLDHRGLEQACERAARIEVLNLYALTALIARHRGKRGVARLRWVLQDWDEELLRCRSELEVRLFRLVVTAGIERPLVNQAIDAGEASFEVDFHWPAQRLIVETDGRAFHGSPSASRRDAARDRVLGAAGWHIKRFDWADTTLHQATTLATIRSALTALSGS